MRKGFFLLVLLAASVAGAQEIETEDLRIRKLPELPPGSSHGYHERVFEITNRSTTRTHEVWLEMPRSSRSFRGNQTLQQLSGQTIVGPSSTVRLALLQPPQPLAGGDVLVRVDGFEVEGQLSSIAAHPNSNLVIEVPLKSGTTTEPVLRVLVSQRARIDAFPQEPDAERYLRSTVPVSAWSENWLAYSSYDGIVLAAEDLEEGATLGASAATRQALQRYADAGGSLLVAGSSTSPPSPLADHLHSPAVPDHGFDIFHSGLGEVLISPLPAEELTLEQFEFLARSWHKSREPWTVLRDPAAAHRLFKVTSNVEIPLRGLFLVVVVFTLLIGPINIWWLTRIKKRIWMLWTVPVAALLTSALVFAYALFSEGLLRIERGASLTVLDERTRSASTYGWLGYYSTLTPGDGLHFSRQTEVSPILRWSYGRGGLARRLHWQEDQHFEAGFVNARLPVYFVVRKPEMRRERLGVRYASGHNTASGSVEVTNGLGAAIETLYLADAEGRVHHSSGRLEAGASATLVLDSKPATGNPKTLRSLYKSELPKQLSKITDQPHVYLQAGTYVAVLDGNPFLDEALADVRESRRRTVVYGFQQ